MAQHEPPWWKHAVCYQVYVRSFADGDGDGVGDLPGVIDRLPHLRDLGVDAVWLTPFYRSPQHDHGYDVADPRDVDPLFGTLADAERLVDRAHDLGLRVLVDLVPNHTSVEHPWFVAALAGDPDGPERARYLFREGRGPDGAEPPNNWESLFGGPAWTRVADAPDGRSQWYLHLFDPTQPDLDWRNPEVVAEYDDVLRFWLDRGVDGFRIDVAHGLVKEKSLRDQTVETAHHASMVERDRVADEPMWDQPEVHGIYRRWRRLVAAYDGDRMLVGEAWTSTQDSMARFVRPDELHQSFNFAWLLAPWSATAFAEVITSTLAALAPVGASPTWVLSNHDVERHPTRYGGGARGVARARAATLAMLTLPGSAYLYQGEELGLEEVEVAPEHRQDPLAVRTGRSGRDGCRVPLPWSGEAPPYGFGPGTGQPWIPQPADWADRTVQAQTGDPGSTLELYRRALAERRRFATTAGDEVAVSVEPDGMLVLERGEVVCVLNAGDGPAALPAVAGALRLSSGRDPEGTIDPDTAAWFTRR